MKSIFLSLGCTVMFLISCEIKDPIYNTSHPDRGAVILFTDWSARSEGVNVPAAYTVELNGVTAELTADSVTLPGLFIPGTAQLFAWNVPQGFTIADGKATLTEIVDTRLFTSQADWLFTGSNTVNIIADDTLRVILSMQQRMRLLRFDLTVTEGEYDRITDVKATLNGVATTIDLRAGTLTADTGTVAVVLTHTGNKITGEARLPGISGNRQELAVTLSFENDEPMPRTTRSDLSSKLAGFNDGQLTPITLTGNLRSPIRADMGSTVIDWISGNGSGGQNGSAGM